MLFSMLASFSVLPLASLAMQTKILVPDIPPEINPKSYGVLKAIAEILLYYSTGPQESKTDPSFAIVDIPKGLYPTIVFDHSAYVSAVTCNADTCTFTFTDEKSYQTAAGNWGSSKRPILIISSAAKMPKGHPEPAGSRVYLLVNSIDQHPSGVPPFSFIGKYKSLGFKEIVDKNQIFNIRSGHGAAGIGAPPLPSEIIPSGFQGDTNGGGSRRSAKLRQRAAVDFTSALVPRAFSARWPINIAPKGQVPTPFKDSNGQTLNGVKIYSKSGTKKSGNSKTSGSLDLYCVDCGFRGEVKFYADYSLTWYLGIKSAFVDVNGNARASFGLGLVADFEYTYKPPEKLLADLGIPGLSIPGIFTIGPSIGLYAGANFGIHAEGRLYAGLVVEWPDIQNHLDIKNPGSSYSKGWTPQAKPAYNAFGRIQISADVYVELKLKIGVTILGGLFSAYVSLNDRPGIDVKAAYQTAISSRDQLIGTDGLISSGRLGSRDQSVSRDLRVTSGQLDGRDLLAAEATCNNGVEITVSLYNKIYLEAAAGKSSKQYSLSTVPVEAFNKCYTL